MRSLSRSLCALAFLTAAASSQFVNWESPHVSPVDLTPDGSRLLVVNTPDAVLEVFDASGPALVPVAAIPVGLDPVSVRARNDDEAWVVNHVSDSVSIVDLATGRVVATLDTDDEPCDVVFAGTPERAFVSCSQANTVLRFDPSNLGAAPTRIEIVAEDPRAMAVSPDGQTVYVGIFESGNRSTVLGGGSTMGGGFPPNVVSDNNTPHGGVNPPPNDGASFDPPLNGAAGTPPAVGLIVKQDANGVWRDDTGADWSPFVDGAQAGQSGRPVGWTLLDRDVASIDTSTLAVDYVGGLMNVDMALAVNPVSGDLAVVGTDGLNEVRFEPVLNGRFLRVNLALVDAGTGASTVVDLNPQLDYTTSQLPQPQRDLALGDPRGVAWRSDGARAYVTGMGSNNLVVVDAAGARAGLAPTIEVGEGPTGIRLHEDKDRLYVVNKFDASVSVVSLVSETEVARVPFHDSSPVAIQVGRKHLYSTHDTSGLGYVACGSCHVDSRMDRLAWDLGDPSGDEKPLGEQNLGANVPVLAGSFEDWHPMKGPMLTQTLQDIIGKEPLHWRGDRDGIEEFNPAFVGLQGDDTQLTPTEMQEFEDFLATIHYPPNPFRELDNSLPTDLPLPGHYTTGRFGPEGQPLPNGDAVNGLALYRPPNLLDAVACVTCHTNPTGIGADMELSGLFGNYVQIPPGPNGERHHALVSVDGSTNVTMKTPQLRNLYERTGFNATQLENTAGFGFLHDGSVDSIERFLNEPVFALASDQETADMVAFMLAYSGGDLPQGSVSDLLEPPGTIGKDTHAAVGVQTTLVSLGTAPPAQVTLLSTLRGFADAGAVGLIAKGVQGGEARGYAYLGGDAWQSDRAAETLTTAALHAGAAIGSELTFTVVPAGSETRLGVDRDLDTFLDRDELDAGADPADPGSVPGSPGAFVDLGLGLAGSAGVPVLAGNGSMEPGTFVTLQLTGAAPSSPAAFVIGLSRIDAPFKGGTMVPALDLLVNGLTTDGSGQILVGDTLDAGLPVGLDLYFQWWITDAAGPKGLAASNGLQATVQ